MIPEIWERKEMPKEWNREIIVPLHKKDDQLQCDNYRGITLLNVTYKILANILFDRLQPYVEKVIGKPKK